MSKRLGIEIEIDFSDVDKLKKALSEKVDDIEIGLDTSKADSEYSKLTKKFNTLKSSLSDSLKVKIDTDSALERINQLEKAYSTLKSTVNEGLKFDLDMNSTLVDTFKKISEQAESTQKQTSKSMEEMGKHTGATDGIFGKTNQATQNMADEATKSVSKLNKEMEEVSNNAQSFSDKLNLSHVNVDNKLSTLKQIIAMMKELETLEGKKSSSNPDAVNDALEKRIQLTRDMLAETKKAYEGKYGESSLDTEGLYKVQQAQSQLNLAIREASEEKQRTLDLDKEAKTNLQEFVKLENERSKLMKQADKGDSTGKTDEAQVAREKAEALRSQADQLLNITQLETAYGAEVKETMNTLMATNHAQEVFSSQMTQAKSADKARLEDQKANYKEIADRMKELHRINLQISELESKENAGNISGKESIKLDSLKQQQQIYESIIQSQTESAVAEGKISSEQEKSLSALQKAQTAKEEISANTARVTAEAQKTTQEYDKWAESIQKVSKLSEKLSKAGDEEAEQIRELISAEQEYQAQIEKSIGSLDRRNDVREGELKTQQAQVNAAVQTSEEARQLYQKDQYNQNLKTSGVLGNFFNPRNIYNEGKQAAMAVYNSIKEIDDQLVNIAKVVDAPQAELDAFANTIYDTASKVGRSAADYAVSVERWASSGKTLKESVELAEYSTMGSFVGNVDEAAMVDYMSVPLIAFKEAGLEATDVINAMNEVANNNAIEMSDLGEAYQKAAGTAGNVGTSFSQLTGLISAAQETTRAGGGSIGTALKTIDQNFIKMASQITKEDRRRMEFFKNMGVDVIDANGNLNSTYNILEQLSGAWGDLDDVARGEAVLNFAGKNHSNIATSMLQNWDLVEKAAREAEGQVNLIGDMKLDGSAFQEFAIQQESLEFKTQALKNAWSEFINTVSGGKGVVAGVMDVMTSGVEKLTSLASNPLMKTLMVGGLGLVGAGTMATGIHKAIQITKLGLGDIGIIAKKATLHTGGLFNSVAMMGGKIPGASMFTGLAKGVGVLGGSVLKLVPALGSLYAVYKLLQSFGIDPLAWLGDKLGIGGLTSEIDGFVSKSEELRKKMSENVVFNGKIEGAQNTIDDMQAVIDKKTELYESGDVDVLRPLSFSDEEFIAIQNQFNGLVEDLNLDTDLLITWNNFDEIQTKIAEIQRQKDELLFGSAKELAVDMSESVKVPEQINGVVDKYGHSGISRVVQSQEFKTISEEYDQNILAYKQAQTALRSAIQDMDKDQVEEVFKELPTKDAQYAMLTEVAAQVVRQKNNKTERDGLSTLLEGSKDYWDMWDGGSKANQSDFVIQSKEMLDYIHSLGGEFANLPAEIYAWGDDATSGLEITNGLQEAILRDAENFDGTIAEYEAMFQTLGKELLGLTTSEMEAIQNQASATGIDLIEALFNYGDFGQAALGMGAEWNAIADYLGVSVGEVAKSVQAQVDSMDTDLAIELGLVVEETGLVNFGALEEVMALDSELITHFKLVDESGPNVENIVSFLDSIGENEELVKTLGIAVNEDGKVNLDRFMEYWDTLDDDTKKEMTAEITTQINEPETPTVMTVTGEVEIGDIKSGDVVPIIPVDADTSQATQAINELQESIITFNNMPIDPEIRAGALEVLQNMVNNLREQGVDIELKIKQPNDNLEPIDVPAEVTEIDVVADAGNVEVGVDLKVSEAGLSSQIAKATGGEKVEIPVEFTGGGTGKVEAENQTITVDADTGSADAKIATVGSTLDGLTSTSKDVLIGGNDVMFRTVASSVDSRTIQAKTVQIKGDARHFNAILASVKSAASSVTISIKGSKASSVGIGPQLGTSFSASIGSALTGTQQRLSSKSNEPAKVNEDVWRYWAKELFTGLPLERTMDNLANEIKKAGKNQDKLIDIYRQQIATTDKQIAFEKDMQKAQQAQAQDIVGKLAKYGFNADGIRITNLDRAKSLSGDQASEADKLLSEWKKLYDSISGLDKTIAGLNLDKFELEDDIKTAKIAKELERIESRLKTSEALLTAIDGNTSIQSAREGLVNDSDFELSLAVNEMGLNTSVTNVKALIDEFNKLTKVGVEFEENAEEIYDTLDELKSSILDNADALLEYREAMNEIRIDRMTSDYGKFIDILNTNLDRLGSNVEQLREGLTSGTDISSLSSSVMTKFDVTRRTQLEREQQMRIELEAQLNKTLDDYSRINIDRTAKEAERVLSIEKQKYDQLLKMAETYSKGGTITASNIESSHTLADVIGASQSKEYSAWQKRLSGITDVYAKEYTALMQSYDKMSGQQMSSMERYVLNNNMVISQLKLQENTHREIIKVNSEAIKLAQEELKNTTLTTEQREILLDSVREYEDANIEAQTNIRDSITSRFDVEFSMLDKLMGNVQSYTSELEYMLEIAELIGMSADGKQGLFDAIFSSKVNQYSQAKTQLEALIAEQAKFTDYSLEWNLLDEKINEVRESMRGFGKDALNANKSILENTLEDLRSTFETGILKGKTLDEWKDYTDNWITGLTKEIELDGIRQRLLDNESDVIKKRLEALDRQEAISKKDVEYLDKQLSILELENKLNNIGQERNVQSIVRRDDGTFGLDYSYDQSEYDKTFKELNEARKELEEFKQTQRTEYATGLGSIIDKAESGGFSSTEELQQALSNLNAVYGAVLKDMPDLTGMSHEELVNAYGKYLETNGIIAGDLTGVGGTEGIASITSQFEQGFMNISEEFGNKVAEAIKSALQSSGTQFGNSVYHVDSLVFPNVTNPEGFQEVLETLGQTAKQYVSQKQ